MNHKCKCQDAFENMADLSPEAIQNVASVYNKDNMTVSNLNVTGNITVAGNTTIAKDLKVSGSSNLGLWNIRNDRIGIDGRKDMHLAGDQWFRVYDYNTGNHGGGGLAAGNLWSGGNLDTVNLNGMNFNNTVNDIKNNMVRKDKKYGIQSSRGGYLPDGGGWRPRPTKADNWEVMRFDELW